MIFCLNKPVNKPVNKTVLFSLKAFSHSILLLNLFMACEKDVSSSQDSNFISDTTYSAGCKAGFNIEDNAGIHTTFPRPGQSFKVGQKVRMGFCMEDPSRFLLDGAKLWLVKGEQKASIVEFSDQSLEDSTLALLLQEGYYDWTIPASLEALGDGGLRIQISSDCEECYIRLESYQQPDLDYDMMGPIRIAK